MKTLKLLTVIRQDIDPLSRAVWKSKVLYSCCREEGHKEEPFVMLDKNKLVLNKSAFELLNADPGNRFDIVYLQEGIKIIPCLVNKTLLKQDGGKKLNKSMTISFKGNANDQLAKYGMMFFLTERKDGIWFDLAPMERTSSNNEVIDYHVESGSDFDLDENTTDQTEYDLESESDNEVAHVIKNEDDLDKLLNDMFN